MLHQNQTPDRRWIRNHLHLERFRAINGDSSSLANDLSGVDQIFQDLLVHVGQRPVARALLLDTRCPCGFSQHPALGNKHDVTFRELFLQLPREPEIGIPFSPPK